MKYRCIQVNGIVEALQNMSLFEVISQFVDFAEERGWGLGVRWQDLKGHPDCEDVETWDEQL
jgi:hypothetical protein